MKIVSIFLLLAAVFSLAGCGGSCTADTETPVAEVKQQASTMSVDDLKSKATEYQKAIQAQMEKLEPLKEKLSNIPVTEMLGDEAKSLKSDISDITKDMDALKERLSVYLDALKAKGESVKEYMN